MHAATAVTTAEMALVASDAWALRLLVDRLKTEPGKGVLGLAMAPVLAFYVVEANDWMKRHSGGALAKILGQHDSELRDFRAALKVFDTRKGGLRGVTGRLQDVQQHCVAAFDRHHGGILGPLKRALQDDLGLYFLGSDLVCTTHVAALGSSFLPDARDASGATASRETSPSFQFGQRCGQFIGAVARSTGSAFAAHHARSSGADAEYLWFEDHKAGSYYLALQEKLGSTDSLAAPVTFMIAQVNFVHRWLRHVLVEPSPGLSFRLRFVVCFNALRALSILGSVTRGQPSPLAGLVASQLSTQSARKLRRMERLRNILAHYDLSLATPAELADPQPLAQLVQRRGGMDLDELGATVDEVLESLSCSFRDLVRLSRRGCVLEPPAATHSGAT